MAGDSGTEFPGFEHLAGALDSVGHPVDSLAGISDLASAAHHAGIDLSGLSHNELDRLLESLKAQTPDQPNTPAEDVLLGGYSNSDGTYHWDSDNTDRDPQTGAVVRRW